MHIVMRVMIRRRITSCSCSWCWCCGFGCCAAAGTRVVVVVVVMVMVVVEVMMRDCFRRRQDGRCRWRDHGGRGRRRRRRWRRQPNDHAIFAQRDGGRRVRFPEHVAEDVECTTRREDARERFDGCYGGERGGCSRLPILPVRTKQQNNLLENGRLLRHLLLKPLHRLLHAVFRRLQCELALRECADTTLAHDVRDVVLVVCQAVQGKRRVVLQAAVWGSEQAQQRG
mmetsp:Transcript_14794/g.37093  ORF Transcript_14794/g.37093 Transcript_14794/m.37093 type:complete len:227 (-) Transcript_14794:565-1245(-)